MLTFLLVALALIPALSHAAAEGGGGFYAPARATQLAWPPRSAQALASFPLA